MGGMHLADSDCEVIFTQWSLLVNSAHIDYGKIMYSKSDGLCDWCGIVTSKRVMLIWIGSPVRVRRCQLCLRLLSYSE